jgi:pilus assembly protein CpaB
MPIRTIASLAIAVFLGLIAVVLVRSFLISQHPTGTVSAAGGMTPIVVAAVPLERGVALKPAMLKVVAYPKDAVPVGAFQSVDQLAGKSGPVRSTQRAMTVNEPVLNSKLNGPGAKALLSGVIAPGMRAVSLRSNDVTGVGGFVLPGDRVDILMTRTIGGGGGGAASAITQVLAENALVLGVDQTSDQDTDKPIVSKAVTVQVTPDQAQAISLAENVGSISLDLRQSADNTALTRQATTVADLGRFGARPAPAPVRLRVAVRSPKAPSGLSEIRVTRGVVTSDYSVGTN